MSRPAHLFDRLVTPFLILLAGGLVLESILSLQWRMQHDSPLFAYAAYLMNVHGMFPYRDFFETSMPGTFALHAVLGRIFGYGDLAFRLVDLASLACLASLTWGFMKRFGSRAAWASALLFPLAYLQEGPGMSFQRDYVCILPLACAVLLAVRARRPGSLGVAAGVGFLFGLAATIKPHMLIGLPPIIFYLWIREPGPPVAMEASSRRGAAITSAAAAAGAAAPVLAALAWVWWNGALPRLAEIVFRYLPLHLRLTETHRTIEGFERSVYLIEEYRSLGGHALWLLPACFGLYAVLAREDAPARVRRLAYLLAGLAAVYSLYPVVSGQFFAYHWMPFLYFVTLPAALCFRQRRTEAFEAGGGRRAAFPAALLLSAFFLLGPAPDAVRQIRGLPPAPPEGGRADRIAAFLRERLRPGDTVQPLDWTGGAIHGMLLARARLATSFLYDYHFYHHVSEPYIQSLRWRFMRELEAAPPRFVVEVTEEKPWVWGADTTRDFPDLRRFLARDYRISLSTQGFDIYELKGPEPAIPGSL